MPNITDASKQHRDQYELKKYEELYVLSKTELDKAHLRFSSVEEKAARHFSVLVVLLGFISFGLPEYLSIVKYRRSNWDTSFTVLYPSMLFSLLLSMFFYLRAISFSKYKNIVLNQELFTHFRKYRYVDVIYSMAKRFADDLAILNNTIDKKLAFASTAFKFTLISLTFVILTLVNYIVIKLH